MKATIYLNDTQYIFEKLSDTTYKIHYPEHKSDTTSSWDIRFAHKCKFTDDIALWLQNKLDINGNHYDSFDC